MVVVKKVDFLGLARCALAAIMLSWAALAPADEQTNDRPQLATQGSKRPPRTA